MKKVLVTSRSFGKTSNRPFEMFAQEDVEYTLMGVDFDQAIFEKEVVGYDGLIIGAHPFTAENLKECKNLKIIAKHGAGLDNIPLEQAKEQGVAVTNVPAMNANAVADLAFGHMLNVARGISLTADRVKNGQWKTHIGRDVYAKTLGLIGFGAIAKNVARRANGFSMQVIAYDPFISAVPEEFASFVRLASLDEVTKQSDYISIHVPLTEETKNLFDKKRIMEMKEDAYLINTGRGGIIDEADLYTCMKAGHLSGCAMDVTANEPLEANSPLLGLENVVITPHIGMYSMEAIGAVGIVCTENVLKVLNGEEPNYRIV